MSCYIFESEDLEHNELASRRVWDSLLDIMALFGGHRKNAATGVSNVSVDTAFLARAIFGSARRYELREKREHRRRLPVPGFFSMRVSQNRCRSMSTGG